MKLILEIMPHADDEIVMHRAIEKFPATVGRGFQNDVILTDPHISPLHLHIDSAEDGWVISDLDSANGLFVNNARRRGHCVPVRSGDIVRIGQTEVKFYAPHHPVADTVRIQKSHPVFSLFSRPIVVWGVSLLAFALLQGWTYLEMWEDEPKRVLIPTGAATVGVIILWAALWSVAGRLIKHKSSFKSHVTVASLYLIGGVVTWYIGAYTDFLTNENWLSGLVSYSLNFVLLGLLIYASITLATKLPQRRRKLDAVVSAAAILGVLFAISLISAESFNQQPLYPATLKPYLSQLAPADTIEKFMAGNEKLFSSEEFEDLPAKEKTPPV